MKKSILVLALAFTAAFAFAGEKKAKELKFNSNSISSKIKCGKLAEKAFGSDYRTITSYGNITIWFQDKDNYIYFYEDGKKGEPRSVEGHAKINLHSECYSAIITKFLGENGEESISLGTKSKTVSMSDRIEEAMSYSTNENMPTKDEYKEMLLKQRKYLHDNVDVKIIPSL